MYPPPSTAEKGIVLLLLLSWGIYETVNVFGPAYYAFARDAAYPLLTGFPNRLKLRYSPREAAMLQQ